MKKTYIFLADGFEEVEGLTVVDLLRRAGILVVTVAMTENLLVHGAHGINVSADQLFSESSFQDGDMLILPGGQPGTEHLRGHVGLSALLQEFHEQGKYLAAICAAPSILGGLGILKDRCAVSYPTAEEQLTGAFVQQDPVVRDGHIITSRGLGTAIDFALELIAVLLDSRQAEKIANAIIYSNSNQ